MKMKEKEIIASLLKQICRQALWRHRQLHNIVWFWPNSILYYPIKALLLINQCELVFIHLPKCSLGTESRIRIYKHSLPAVIGVHFSNF